MATVKCQITKEVVDKKLAYKVTKDGKNKYYKNKDIYDKFESDTNIKQQIKDIIVNICGKEQYSALDAKSNMLFNKKMKDINFDLDVILLTLLDKKSQIYDLTRKITSTSGRILYIFTVISENINVGIEKKILTNKQDSAIIDLSFMEDSHRDIKREKVSDITKFL